MRVSLINSGRSFSVAATQSLLEAALAAALNVPHSCRHGNCGACRAQLVTGTVEYPRGPPLGLSSAEAADGYVLLCQARAVTNLSLDMLPVGRADEIIVKRLPCRIARTDLLAPDVMRVELRLPAAEPFAFQAGQHIDLRLPGGLRRSYSIACPPHDCQPLQLHVRHVPGGKFSEMLFGGGASGALLEIDGPFGRSYYQHGTAPILLVGGGTGLAPLLSIMRHVREQSLPRTVRLYWGVRAERDLYEHARLLDLCEPGAQFAYIPVLSESTPAWRGRRGLVHEALMRDVTNLAAYDIYAAGPPAMIGALQRDFIGRGATAERLWLDSFDYAIDPPALAGSADRHDSAAPTKS